MKNFFFIYLVSITMIINIQAAEEHEQSTIRAGATQLSVRSSLSKNNLQKNSPRVETFEDIESEQEPDSEFNIDNLKNVSSLEELTKLTSNRIEEQKIRSRKLINQNQLEKIANEMIGDRANQVRFNPEIFLEYAENCGIQSEQPGFIKRIFCCRSQRTNPFVTRYHHTPNTYNTWSKQLAKIFLCENVLNSLMQPTRGRSILQKIDEEDHGGEIRYLEIALLKEKLKNEMLTSEKDLAQTLLSLLNEQKEKEESCDKAKEILWIIAGIAGSFAAGAFGV